ncbi:MAG: DegT/DnrJ/EryC1/StrS family aminotransferase [Candidatus Thermoplasmatota archaeon]|nr:DegT/DnrJ/EryC1/StrS family aminotransferase [Candidatus Thermoplasmatota archaeon]
MKWKIPLFKMYWDKQDIIAVTKVIKRASYWTMGPEVQSLEDNIAGYVERKQGVSFNSGTSALHATLLAYDIKKGDEVIVPSFTFIATANVVVLAGATPIFADIEPRSYALDPEDVKERITSKTKAIIPIHYGGSPCKEIKALQEIAADHHLLFIEDACESLGAEIHSEKVGTFSDAAIFSFCQNKVITAGEGGLVVTDSKTTAEKLRLIRSHGRVENTEGYFATTQDLDYIQAGYNYRLPSINAALVLSQFNKINKIIQKRREKATYYTKHLSTRSSIRTPGEAKGEHHVYQLYTIELPDKKNRDSLQQYLTRAGIMTKIYFEPIHLKTYYRNEFHYKKNDLPVTEEISEKVLTLPLYPALTKKEMEYIISKIKKRCP